MDSFVYFSGMVQYNGTDFEITATSDDDVRTIMQKALEIEFWSEIEIYDESRIKKTDDLPDKYIYFSIAYSRHVLHADNSPHIKKTNFDVTFVSKDLNLKKTIPSRIVNTLINKGFYCVATDRDLHKDELTEYYAVQQEFAWYGGA